MVNLTHDNKTTINNNAIIGLVKNWLNIFQKSIIVKFWNYWMNIYWADELAPKKLI